MRWKKGENTVHTVKSDAVGSGERECAKRSVVYFVGAYACIIAAYDMIGA